LLSIAPRKTKKNKRLGEGLLSSSSSFEEKLERRVVRAEVRGLPTRHCCRRGGDRNECLVKNRDGYLLLLVDYGGGLDNNHGDTIGHPGASF
ncbi:hypothetical protein PanWU01x14_286520, partial [Parasponia andersonii]